MPSVGYTACLPVLPGKPTCHLHTPSKPPKCATMKCIILLFTLLIPVAATQAQSKKQRKALLEQIVKLQIYLGYVKKGYNILDKGLTTIGSVKNGDWTLHRLFLDKRKLVSPKVKSYTRIAAIITAQSQLVGRHRAWQDQMAAFPETAAAKTAYYHHRTGQMLDQTAALLQELLLLLTDGQYQMTDTERIDRIEQVYALHTRQARQLHSFCDQSLANTPHHHLQAAQLRHLQQQY